MSWPIGTQNWKRKNKHSGKPRNAPNKPSNGRRKKMIDAANAKANQEMMDSKRKNLGAAAKGKSDAEVNRLYDAKIKQTTDEANRLAQEARSALSQGQGAAAVKQVTGKSLQELENMSDEEADALSRELEKKYGQ